MSDIAVVIPCWNLGATVEEAVASALAQTRPPAQVVVVDDGSDDPATLEALGRLAAGPAKVVHTLRGGVARARERGARETSSEYLVLLDADDLLAPTFLERTAARLDAEPLLDFVATSYELFGDVQARCTPPPPDQPMRHLCEGSYCITGLLRRRLWEELGGCDPSLEAAEDWDFWLRVLESGARGELLDEALFRYRVRAGSRDPRGLARERFLPTLKAIVAKHQGLIEALGPALLEAKARAAAEMHGQVRRLIDERRSLGDELARLEQQLEPRPRQAAAVRRSAPLAVVLCYHRVASLSPDSFGLCVPPALFREHLEYLRRECRPLSLETILQASDARELPPRAVALTFDDGYLDAFEASRCLGELGLPATFYVNAERLDEPHEAWQEVLERIFLGEEELPPAIELGVEGAPLYFPCLGPAARRAAFDTLYQLGRGATARGRRELIERVSSWSGLKLAPRESHRVLTGSEIRELAQRPGHEIGAHSAHHLLLPAHPSNVQRREVEEGKLLLEQLLGKTVRSFAYPYGECPARTMEIARQVGFQSAVSTRSAALRPWDDPLELPRLEVGAWSLAELARRVEALFAAVSEP